MGFLSVYIACPQTLGPRAVPLLTGAASALPPMPALLSHKVSAKAVQLGGCFPLHQMWEMQHRAEGSRSPSLTHPEPRGGGGASTPAAHCPLQCGSVLKEAHCPLPPLQCGSVLKEPHCPMPPTVRRRNEGGHEVYGQEHAAESGCLPTDTQVSPTGPKEHLPYFGAANRRCTNRELCLNTRTRTRRNLTAVACARRAGRPSSRSCGA